MPRSGSSLTAVVGVLGPTFLLAAPAPAADQGPASQPVGMVDQPCPAGSQGRTDVEQAFANTVVTDGPMDPKVLLAYANTASQRAKADELRAKTDWADLCRYSAANAGAARTRGVKVVFFGNSITELWQAADPALFTGGVVDRGISGETSGQGLVRFYPDVVALHPKVVHILVGTNDIAGNNGPNRPEDFKNNIRAMVDIAKANHVQVILASITPAGVIPWRKEINASARILELNAWMSAYAKANGVIYVDYHRVLAGPDGAMKPGLSRDGVHPLRSGYALMTPLAKAAVAKALATSPR